MTDLSIAGPVATQAGETPRPTARDPARTKRRRAAERRFRRVGLAALAAAITILAILVGSIALKGYTAFVRTEIRLEIFFDPEVLDPHGTADPAVLATADYAALVKRALYDRFPEVTERREKRALRKLLSEGAGAELRRLVLDDSEILGTTRAVWLPADDAVDMLFKGDIDRASPETERHVRDNQLAWLDALAADGAVATVFNSQFFTAGDSREPELAGIWGAVVGSFYTIVMTLLLSVPLGVGAAIYLQEFASTNRWADFIEVNINNLAAVPSIVFGLLGLAVFLDVLHLPRSAPIVGGLTLALMTLPTIVVASRAALRAVSPSIRDAARGIGASPIQVVAHHVLPVALPSILTGMIIGTARAMGETAPLLMIGMVAFIVDVPQGMFDPATALPVQIYLWADSPERAFVEKTSAAVMVLLAFVIAMNGLAVWLRKRYETKC